jgi:chromosome partitioning protein
LAFDRFTTLMITSVATQKGGVGKTTTSVSLAAGLAHRGNRILLIDIDFQANASKWLLPDYVRLKADETIYRTIIKRQPLPVYPTIVPNLDIVPSHILLSDTDIELTTVKDHREERLKTQLQKVQGQYQHIFIDCPPALNWLTINAFTTSDNVVIAVEPGYFELDSLVQITKTIKEVQEYFNPALKIRGILFTKSDPTVSTRTSLQVLRDTYSIYLLNTIIPRNVEVKDAQMNRQDIFTYNPKAKAALAYDRLIRELYEL